MLSGWAVQCFHSLARDGGDSRRRCDLGLRPFRQTPGNFLRSGGKVLRHLDPSHHLAVMSTLLSFMPFLLRVLLAFAWPQPQNITTHKCMHRPASRECLPGIAAGDRTKQMPELKNRGEKMEVPCVQPATCVVPNVHPTVSATGALTT